MDILQRGQSMVFLKKSTFSLSVLLSKESQKETFFDLLDRKECFLDHKRKLLKNSKKIDILQRGQSMVFIKKSTFFLYVFFQPKKPERNIFLILDSKECFLDPKSEILAKSKKSTFCKGLVHGFCQKIDLFFLYVFFQPKKPERNIFLILDSKECFLDPKSEILAK